MPKICDPRITKAAKLLLENPLLMPDQAMRAAGFTYNDALCPKLRNNVSKKKNIMKKQLDIEPECMDDVLVYEGTSINALVDVSKSPTKRRKMIYLNANIDQSPVRRVHAGIISPANPRTLAQVLQMKKDKQKEKV